MKQAEIIYRRGVVGDSDKIAELMLLAGGGIIEFLLHDLVPGLSPQQLLTKEIVKPDSEFSYQNAMIAEYNHNIVGIAHFYPVSLNQVPEGGDLPQDRIEHVRGFYENQVAESLYLQTLATSATIRGKGIGAHLLGLVKEKAIEQGFNKVSLHVWADNVGAQRLYKRVGFKVIKVVDIKPHKLMPHEGGMLLMCWDLS